MSNFIEVKDVNYSIKQTTILKDINITLNKNEFTALIGHNGSGKTTLGKLIVGIIKPTKGELYLSNKNIKGMSLAEIGTKIGYLFQNPNRQIFAPTVYEELTFTNKINNEVVNDGEVDSILKAFDLLQLKDEKTYFLSHGEKQRLALATIMLNKPEYLILDEPTTGLDQKRKAELSKLLKEITEKGIGTLMISHDFDFINMHADRVIELHKGEIIS